MKSPLVTLRPFSVWLTGSLLGFGLAAVTFLYAAEKALPAAPSVPSATTKAPASPATAYVTKEWRLSAGTTAGVAPESSIKSQLANHGSAKQWLTEKGIVFQGEATAVFIPATRLLIVRNTQAQLDLIDVLVGRESIAPAMPPDKTSSLPAKDAAHLGNEAGDPVIPKIELRDATPAQAFKTITDATGTKVFYTPAPGAPEARITISLTNVPMSEALRYLTSLADLKFTTEKDGIHVTK